MAEGGRIHEENRPVDRLREGGESIFSSETSVDAEPEGVTTEPGGRSPAASPMTSVSIRGQGYSQPLEHQPKMSINDLNERLPPHVRDDYIEILIINAEEDKEQANILKENLEQHVRFCKANYKPNVVLLDDIISPHKNEALDYAVERTIYIFLYVTEEFCEQHVALFQSHSCLKKALNSPEDKWSVVPVHTRRKSDRKYELPLMLDSLRSLNLLNKTFFQEVKKLLEFRSHLILERKDKREKELNEIISKNCFELKARDAEQEKLSSDQTQCMKQSGSGVGKYSLGDIRIKPVPPGIPNEDFNGLEVSKQLSNTHVNISQSDSLADTMNDITIDSAPKQGFPDSETPSMEHEVSIDGGGSLQPALYEVCTNSGISLQPTLSKASSQLQGVDCQEQTQVKAVCSVQVEHGSPSKLSISGNKLPAVVIAHSNPTAYPQYLCQQASTSKDFMKNPLFHKFPADTNHNTRMYTNQSTHAKGAPQLSWKDSTPAPEANPGHDSSTQYNVNVTNFYLNCGPTHKTTNNYITRATNVALGESHIDVHGIDDLEPVLLSDSSDNDFNTT